MAASGFVTPFARSLKLLSVFTPQERWLARSELAARSGLPASTVARIVRDLVALKYLHFAPETRRYRLAAAVLALGYAAIANTDVLRCARTRMHEFANEHQVHVALSSRDRLDALVLESCIAASAPVSIAPPMGMRAGIASSVPGWALMAALPELERYYLMEGIERHQPREWPRLRRSLAEAVRQVHDLGYCTSLGERDPDRHAIAVPVVVEGHAPIVVSCIGTGAIVTRARVARYLGPRMLAMARQIQQGGSQP